MPNNLRSTNTGPQGQMGRGRQNRRSRRIVETQMTPNNSSLNQTIGLNYLRPPFHPPGQGLQEISSITNIPSPYERGYITRTEVMTDSGFGVLTTRPVLGLQAVDNRYTGIGDRPISNSGPMQSGFIQVGNQHQTQQLLSEMASIPVANEAALPNHDSEIPAPFASEDTSPRPESESETTDNSTITDFDTKVVASISYEELWDPNHWTSALHCCICFEYFQDAYVLVCGHTFCRGCLEMLAKTEYNNNGFNSRRPFELTPVICPTCRYTTPYHQYSRYAPRNRAIETVIDAWKTSDDRSKLLVTKVERGLQTKIDETESNQINGKAETRTEHMAVQTDVWPVAKIQIEASQQVSLPAEGQDQGIQTSVQNRDMYVQTRKTKNRTKETQTKTSKYSNTSVQAGEIGFALRAPKVNACTQSGIRPTVGTRYTQTPRVEKQKIYSSANCQTEIQSSRHLKIKKGEFCGPWMACGNPFCYHVQRADSLLIFILALSVSIFLDWQDITSWFVADAPTVSSKDHYTWYTWRLLLESMGLFIWHLLSIIYLLVGLLIKRRNS